MSIVQIIGAAIGGIIIVATLWNLIRNGIARSNGKSTDFEDAWMGDNLPGGPGA